MVGSNFDIVGIFKRVLVLAFVDDVDEDRIVGFWTRMESPRVLRFVAGVVETGLVFLPESMRFPLLAKLDSELGLSGADSCLRAETGHPSDHRRAPSFEARPTTFPYRPCLGLTGLCRPAGISSFPVIRISDEKQFNYDIIVAHLFRLSSTTCCTASSNFSFSCRC